MANSPPTLTGLTPVTFFENTVNAAPQLIAPDVTFTDPDNNFNGGTLTVTGLLAEDTVAIRNQGGGAGEIGVVGTAVFFEGGLIGVFEGGAGSTLTVALLSGATAPGIEALIENLTYANSSDTPTASRGLEFNVTDAAGATTSIAPASFAEPIRLQHDGSDIFAVYGVSVPSLADLDGDGDLDAVIGDRYGQLYYFADVGSATLGDFEELIGPFMGVDVGFYSAPTFADLDGDGDLDLVVGSANGNLYYFRNTGSPVAPAFTEITGAANPFNNWNNISREDLERRYSAPTFADLDGDGDFDAIVGISSGLDGHLRYFKNTGSATAPAFTDLSDDPTSPFYHDRQDFFAAPTFADRDGDFDLVVGGGRGGLIYYKNTTERFTVAVHVTAENDPAVLSADVRNLTETNAAADLSSSGTLTITDPDSAGMFVEQAGTVGLYGTFTINMGGGLHPVWMTRA